MAAFLRHGARMVGGSVVQRKKAAFTTLAAAAEEWRLLTTTQSAHAGRRPLNSLQEVLPLIADRKEELYDTLASTERAARNNYQNRELLKFLSVQVKPRPDDSLWRRMRALKRMKDAARATVLVTGCTLGYHVWSLMVQGKWKQWRHLVYLTEKQR